MKLLNLDSSKTYLIPDLYLNIGHLLDNIMMLIIANAAFDAGIEFGISYEEIILIVKSMLPPTDIDIKEELKKCLRIWNDDVKAGGFFVAVLKKEEEYVEKIVD